MESNSITALSRQYDYCKQRPRGRAAGNRPALGAEGDGLRDHGCLFPPPNAASSDLADLSPSQVVIVEGFFPRAYEDRKLPASILESSCK